jgi:hypothetical protein
MYVDFNVNLRQANGLLKTQSGKRQPKQQRR